MALSKGIPKERRSASAASLVDSRYIMERGKHRFKDDEAIFDSSTRCCYSKRTSRLIMSIVSSTAWWRLA